MTDSLRGRGSNETAMMYPSRRRMLLIASQWAALAIAAYLGWRAYELVDRVRTDIDEASIYYAIALGLALYFTWDGGLPDVPSWPRRTLAYIRAHPVELGVLAVICAAGIFVRLFRYGTLPPHGYVILEEHIYGGIQWDILRGSRPYIYPLPTYLGALSQWLIGPSTTGLRAHTLAAGILTIPVFYLMMREVTQRPGALFATGIWASLRVVNDIGPPHHTLFLGELLLVWLTLRALNTGRIAWLVPAAALAAVLSYEYESAKALPLFVAPFLAWVSLRAVFWPAPRGLTTIVERVRELGPRALRAVAVVTVVVFVLIGPMVAENHRGRNIYFSSLDRQRADREARGTPGLISPDWLDQLKWSAQAYTPWVDPDFEVVGSVATGGLIDKMTSLLIWAGVVSGILFFWKGYRALFIGWFLGGMAMSSLLLSNWAPWKVVGWMIPAVGLTGFLADDAYALLRRLHAGSLTVIGSALAAIAALALVLNVRTLNANAHDERVLGEFSNSPSYLYTICDHLQRRPDDNFAFVTQRVRSPWGFSKPPENAQERRVAWGDFRFICWGLEGRSAADLQEVWPLYVDEDRPYSLATAISDEEAPAVIEGLARAMPELGTPDTHDDSPGRGFQMLIWDTSRDEINARRGLVLRQYSNSGDLVSAEVVPGPRFHITPEPGSETFGLTGLVYLDTESDITLAPLAGAPPVRVTVDGAVTYDPASGPTASTRRLRGWHLVEIRGLSADGGDIELQWQDGNGNAIPTSGDGYFALADAAVWQHERAYVVDGTEFRAIRYDFAPHVISMDGLPLDARASLPLGATATRDRYSGVWNVDDERTYRLGLTAPEQVPSLVIDGKELLPNKVAGTTWVVDVPLSAGDHTVQITLVQQGEKRYIGGLFAATDAATGEIIPIEIRPF